jgi:hypothetical protein
MTTKIAAMRAAEVERAQLVRKYGPRGQTRAEQAAGRRGYRALLSDLRDSSWPSPAQDQRAPIARSRTRVTEQS